jgi:hypothetical protein
VALSATPIISADVRSDPIYINARDKTRSEMVAPIISNDEVIGVFDLESDQFNAYSEDDLEVLMMLASQVAIIIEKVMLHELLIEKKRLEGQLEVARQVQLALLPPQDPEIAGYDISAYNFPTEEVSGDYYDWVKIYDNQIGVVIADVAGKGVPAAILMAFLRASLRAASHIGYATHISLYKVNYLLWQFSTPTLTHSPIRTRAIIRRCWSTPRVLRVSFIAASSLSECFLIPGITSITSNWSWATCWFCTRMARPKRRVLPARSLGANVSRRL